MFGILDKEKIEKVLHGNFIGRLGCNSGSKTYIVPISFAYDGESIYARSFEGLKVSMMRKNPEVCFQVDSMEDMANWQSVICWGHYKELIDEEERTKGLQLLTHRNLPQIVSETVKLSSEWPFPANDLNNIKGIVFKINLTQKTGRFEGLNAQPK